MKPSLLDSDTLSELSRGHARVTARASRYVEIAGRFTLSAVSVFERLRGYRTALRAGKPFEPHLRSFEAFVTSCDVLPVDSLTADVAATLWAALPARRRAALGDILIAATASANGLVLVTRNERDFAPMTKIVPFELVNWAR